MKRVNTWLGCSVLFVGLAAMPAVGQGQPDLSGPPVQQDGNRAGPGGGRQFNGDRAQRPGDKLMGIVQQLNLTEEQRAKVHEILKANAGNMAENRKAMQEATEQLKAAMQSKDQEKIKVARENIKQLRDGDREKVVSQLSTVLNDEQKAKFQELLKQEAPGRQGPGGPEGRREGPLEKLQGDLAELNLTADQKTQVQEIVKAHRDVMEKYQAEHKDQMEPLRKKLHEAIQSKDREAAQAAREQIRELTEGAPVKPKDLIDQISKVLTEEQTRKLRQSIREQRRDGQAEGDEMQGPRRRGPGPRDGTNPPPPPADQLDL